MSTEVSVTPPKFLLKRWFRPLIPRWLLNERELYYRLPAHSRRTYAILRTLRTLGLNRGSKRKLPPSARSLVFVCFGNIMRSPMAEVMLKRVFAERALTGFTIRSAGLHACPGREAHPLAATAAAEMGYSLAAHHASLFDAQLVQEADAILAMDLQNFAELLSTYPQARSKMFMLGAYGKGRQKGCEIPDPYYGDQDAARRCYGVLESCIRSLADHMSTAGSVR